MALRGRWPIICHYKKIPRTMNSALLTSEMGHPQGDDPRLNAPPATLRRRSVCSVRDRWIPLSGAKKEHLPSHAPFSFVADLLDENLLTRDARSRGSKTISAVGRLASRDNQIHNRRATYQQLTTAFCVHSDVRCSKLDLVEARSHLWVMNEEEYPTY